MHLVLLYRFGWVVDRSGSRNMCLVYGESMFCVGGASRCILYKSQNPEYVLKCKQFVIMQSSAAHIQATQSFKSVLYGGLLLKLLLLYGEMHFTAKPGFYISNAHALLKYKVRMRYWRTQFVFLLDWNSHTFLCPYYTVVPKPRHINSIVLKIPICMAA